MTRTAPKKAMIRARAEPRLKARAETTLRKLGLSPSTAINLFYHQVVLQQGLPFEVALPNRTTLRAMGDAAAGRRLLRGRDIAELIRKLDAAAA
ncbi:MAG: type II toxin-antitoxin system RelB/DinJ family antitoxin [Gemmatimonadetes bacterium]|nr:type II toxin-antitoxin system RelB/DinJ family antitoxin [Gemmatimonadota bacterium]